MSRPHSKTARERLLTNLDMPRRRSGMRSKSGGYDAARIQIRSAAKCVCGCMPRSLAREDLKVSGVKMIRLHLTRCGSRWMASGINT